MAWRNGLCSFRRVDFCVTCVHQARGTGVHKSSTRGLINYLPRTNSSQVPLLALALKSHNFTRRAMWWRKLVLDEIWSIRPEVQSSFISTPFWSFVSYPNLLLWNFLHSDMRLLNTSICCITNLKFSNYDKIKIFWTLNTTLPIAYVLLKLL